MRPFRIADDVYYVGSSDIASYLITSPGGHILIDAGYVETVPIIEASLATLGFRLRDVKILLNTQAHFDHAGGFAQLKAVTGAQLMISEVDAALMEGGGRGDFYFGDKGLFPPVRVDRRLKDGETVRLGGIALTGHLTPGHTKGCTTWTFDASDVGRNDHVVDLCGLTILDGTRLSGMPGYANISRDYAHTFEVLKELPVDIFLGAHASYFDGMAKAEKLRRNPSAPNPFVDPQGYRTFVERMELRFKQHLARERH